MYKLGQREKLYLRKIKQEILLQKEGERQFVVMDNKELSPEDRIGEVLDVFLYNDNETIYATKKTPKISLHEIKVLECRETTKIGAFFDWGLEKDLLLPFSEQLCRVKKGHFYPVFLYLDKSNRLCLTMRIKERLTADSPYQRNERVEGIVYNIVPGLGMFIAVDGKYEAMMNEQEIMGAHEPGETIICTVKNVKPDGRLDLTMRDKNYKQMHQDADLLIEMLDSEDGFLPFNDKSDADEIKRVFQMSKSGFKRAVGRLLKQGKIEFYRNGIRRRK